MLKKFADWMMSLAEEVRVRKARETIAQIGEDSVFRSGLKIVGGKYIRIGRNFYAGPNCRIEAWEEYEGETFNPSIQIGDHVSINSECHIGAIRSVVIGNDTLLGSHVLITDHSHGNTTKDELEKPPSKRKLYSKGGVVIGEKCWLGENCVILPGVTIGKCCVIGANAVVTHDLPDYSVAAGNPAEIVNR